MHFKHGSNLAHRQHKAAKATLQEPTHALNGTGSHENQWQPGQHSSSSRSLKTDMTRQYRSSSSSPLQSNCAICWETLLLHARLEGAQQISGMRLICQLLSQIPCRTQHGLRPSMAQESP
jgi:hypothetical protein